MSDEDDTIKPPAPTEPDHEPPSEPLPFDAKAIELSGAPDWAREFFSFMHAARVEEKATLARIERNQRLQRNETRRLSRRVADHDEEIAELRGRVEDLEDRSDAE